MAKVFLYDDDLDDLPDVCACCAAPATTWKAKQFSWHPPWIFFLILVHILVYAIVALVSTKRRKVNVPLCDAHKGHWLWRNLIIFGGIAGLGLLFVAAILLIESASPNPNQQSDLVLGFICLGGGVAAVIWLIAVLVLQNTAIRPEKIDDEGITLKNVAPGFVSACEDRWLDEPDLDRTARERWRDRRFRREEDGYPPRREDRYRE